MIRWALLPLLLAAVPAFAAEPAAATAMSADAAVRFALENNPSLAVARQQRGLAAAGVVLARVYPYNPVASAQFRGVNGPAESGVTNHFSNQVTVQLDVEIRGQWRERRAAAEAGVTRTEWEIADQEVATAVATYRAYASVLYRQQKLDILDETVRLNEQVVNTVEDLRKAGKAGAADLIVARSELATTKALRGQGLAALVAARSELRRQLGTVRRQFRGDRRTGSAAADDPGGGGGAICPTVAAGRPRPRRRRHRSGGEVAVTGRRSIRQSVDWPDLRGQ